MLFPFHDENPTTRPPIVTLAVIAINIAALFYMGHIERSQGPLRLQAFIYKYGFIPLRIRQLVQPQEMQVQLQAQLNPMVRPEIAVLRLPPSRGQIIVSLFTAMFLHANLMHLLGNMWFFWLFGNNIEDRLGHVPFLLFYLAGGLFASAVHWAMSPAAAQTQPVIGASGAVAVTLGAYAVTYPFANIRTLLVLIIFITVVELPALIVLGAWFFVQLLNGLQPPIVGSTVAWWAHIGGFVAGAVCMPLIDPHREDLHKSSSDGTRQRPDHSPW